jgi:hypothetical protein
MRRYGFSGGVTAFPSVGRTIAASRPLAWITFDCWNAGPARAVSRRKMARNLKNKMHGRNRRAGNCCGSGLQGRIKDQALLDEHGGRIVLSA